MEIMLIRINLKPAKAEREYNYYFRYLVINQSSGQIKNVDFVVLDGKAGERQT